MNIKLVDNGCHFLNCMVYSRQKFKYPYHLYFCVAWKLSCPIAFKIKVTFWKDWKYIRYLQTTCTTFCICILHALHSVPANYMHYVLYLHITCINPLKPELNLICYLLALLGAHHFLHVSRIRVKLLTFRLLMSYIYGAPILDVSRSHTTTQHSR